MTSKPGNQPDPDDMANPLASDAETHNPASAHSDPAVDEAEEEAARLGDFA